METSFLKTAGQAVASSRLNGWDFWVIKYSWKGEIKASLLPIETQLLPKLLTGTQAHWRVGPCSCSLKGPPRRKTRGHWGNQPCRRNTPYGLIVGDKEKRNERETQRHTRWCVRNRGWRHLLQPWSWHAFHWAPDAALKLGSWSETTRDPSRPLHYSCQLGVHGGYSSEVKCQVPVEQIWPGKQGRGSFCLPCLLLLTLWMELGVKRLLSKGCISLTGAPGNWVYQVPIKCN